jgi:PAS domain-containing protein
VPDGTRPKNVVLILAREFATRLATAMFIADEEGRLVFYNEPAEAVIGRSFAEMGEVDAESWTGLLQIEDLDGEPMPLEERASGIAFFQRRAAHQMLRMTGLDGVNRIVSSTAFPLFAHADEFVGIVLIFWEEPPAAG